MYCILVYDVGQERVGKMLKLCRRYLNWIQNSVLEGELTEVKLRELTHQAKALMDEKSDSLIIFTTRDKVYMGKQVIGRERGKTDVFL